MGQPILAVELLQVCYTGKPVLEDVSLTDNSCFSRFAQKDFKITFVAWN